MHARHSICCCAAGSLRAGLIGLGVTLTLTLSAWAAEPAVPGGAEETIELPVAPATSPVIPAEGGVIPFAPDANPELPELPAEGAVIPFAPLEAPMLEEPAPAPEATPPEKPSTTIDDAWDDITHSSAYSNTVRDMSNQSELVAGLLGNAPADSSLGDEFQQDLLGGLTMSALLSGTYDSNITRGQTQSGSQPTDDFFLSLGGNLSYLSRAPTWTFGGNYRGRYDEYLKRAEFSGYSQGGGVVVNYKSGRFTASAIAGIDANRGSPQNYASSSTFGGTPSDNFDQAYNQANFNRLNRSASVLGGYHGDKFSATASIGIDMDEGSNSYASSTSRGVTTSTSIHTSLSGQYRLGGKTSLTGNFSQNTTTASGGNYNDTNSLTLGTSAMWRYSVRTQIGPGIRYTSSTNTSNIGGLQIDRTTIGPTLSVNYKLSKKISLASQVGLDFAQYGNGQSADPTTSGSLMLNYQASSLWGMSLAYSRDVQADPTSVAAFYQSNSLRLGYNRKIRKASLGLGASYQTSTAVVPQGGLAVGRPDTSNLSLDSTLSLPIFSNKGSANLFIRYNDQSGMTTGLGTSGSSWNSFQTGFSISRSF